jgi:hypothetical protein
MLVGGTGGRMERASQVGDLAGIGPGLAGLAERAAGDAVLLRRGRYLNTTCQLIIGDRSVLLRIIDGRVAQISQGSFGSLSATFAIIGRPEVWQRFLAADPPPGDHDLFAFLKRRELRVVGDFHPLMSYLLYWKGVFACLREAPR